ncbi:MAG: hypothetical protein Q7K57_19910 [Burkholderiaceae bacterium]|nr:hypothetical protein [Burkholderiaceae bacterium]
MEIETKSSSRIRFGEAIRRARGLLLSHWFLTLLLGIYLLYKLLGVAWVWVLTPTVNPHPIDSVTIRGTFPFDKGLDLYPTQEAFTTTHWVNRICGILVSDEGIPCQGGWRNVSLQKTDAAHYEITFYRDYYLPGIAGWKHAGLGYSARNTGSSMRGGSRFPNRTTAVKCIDGSKEFDRSLICLDINKAGPDIYDQATRQADINFYLVSELTPKTKERK